LAHLDHLDELIATVSGQVDGVIAPFAEDLARLDALPGVNRRIAEVILAEIGTDMRVFPTAGHLASWTGLCPGNTESAGKHRSGKPRKGNRWLRSALTEAALASTRASRTAFAARYRRIMPHRGHTRRPWLRWRMRCSPRPITCWRDRPRTGTWAPTTTTAGMLSASGIGPSTR
jgi:transposase